MSDVFGQFWCRIDRHSTNKWSTQLATVPYVRQQFDTSIHGSASVDVKRRYYCDNEISENHGEWLALVLTYSLRIALIVVGRCACPGVRTLQRVTATTRKMNSLQPTVQPTVLLDLFISLLSSSGKPRALWFDDFSYVPVGSYWQA